MPRRIGIWVGAKKSREINVELQKCRLVVQIQEKIYTRKVENSSRVHFISTNQCLIVRLFTVVIYTSGLCDVT